MKKLLTAVLMWFVVSPAVLASGQKDLPPALDEWVKAYESFDLETFVNFYTEDTSFVDPTARIHFKSRNELRAAFTTIMQGRWGGNFRFGVNSVVSEGNVIVFEGLFSLTFNGEKAEIAYTTWLEFEGGKIKRQLDLFDYAALRRQLPNYGQSLPSEYTGPRD